ncbi:hypothetical protein SAMN05444158_2892 [Bradyrhizobium canariense]|uniref:Uncharacterized protein n=1 Tax=Bradyrhizobium canariense TaxID=255045 RepID=A0A1H1UBQ2_9BRAD|nr:hypothetical protein SAMN05444158_2892 [Bradyrhizobium canariense]
METGARRGPRYCRPADVPSAAAKMRATAAAPAAEMPATAKMTTATKMATTTSSMRGSSAATTTAALRSRVSTGCDDERQNCNGINFYF